MRGTMTQFPINYFLTIFSPLKIFTNRGKYKIWQLALIVLLLNGLMVLPLANAIGRMSSVNLDEFFPKVVSQLSDNTLARYNTYVSDWGLDIHEVDQEFFPDQESAIEALNQKVNGLVFYPQGFALRESELSFLQEFDSQLPLKEFSDLEQWIDFLGNQWFEKNRLSIIMTRFINVWLLNIINFLGLLFGSALLLWLTRFGRMFTIGGFLQAFGLCINAMGLATLISLVIGLILADPQIMTLLQSSLFVLVLLWSYWKTHFNDEYVISNEQVTK